MKHEYNTVFLLIHERNKDFLDRKLFTGVMLYLILSKRLLLIVIKCCRYKSTKERTHIRIQHHFPIRLSGKLLNPKLMRGNSFHQQSMVCYQAWLVLRIMFKSNKQHFHKTHLQFESRKHRQSQLFGIVSQQYVGRQYLQHCRYSRNYRLF